MKYEVYSDGCNSIVDSVPTCTMNKVAGHLLRRPFFYYNQPFNPDNVHRDHLITFSTSRHSITISNVSYDSTPTPSTLLPTPYALPLTPPTSSPEHTSPPRPSGRARFHLQDPGRTRQASSTFQAWWFVDRHPPFHDRQVPTIDRFSLHLRSR